MMNKGLELIEAHFLFEMPEKQIEIVIHLNQLFIPVLNMWMDPYYLKWELQI